MRLITFEQHFKGFWSYILTFQYFGFLMNFRGFRVFAFGYRVYNENPETMENLYFWIYNVRMHVDLFFNLYFSFLSVKTKINKKNNKRLNWIDLEGSDALKRQKYDTQIAMWLNHFEIDVVWTAFKEFLKLHSHISVFWDFSWISVISEFSFLGIGLKTKTRKSQKIFFFYSFFSQTLSNSVLSLLLLEEFVIPL